MIGIELKSLFFLFYVGLGINKEVSFLHFKLKFYKIGDKKMFVFKVASFTSCNFESRTL